MTGHRVDEDIKEQLRPFLPLMQAARHAARTTPYRLGDDPDDLIAAVVLAIAAELAGPSRAIRNKLRDGALAEAKVAQYENAINWHTTCWGCADTLDSRYAQERRAELAEADAAGWRATARRVEDAIRPMVRQKIPIVGTETILAALVRIPVAPEPLDEPIRKEDDDAR